jgi:glutamate 5-kinase
VTAPAVVKLGTSLVAPGGAPDARLLRDVARRLAPARPVCVVSSGAIALGAARAGFAGRPRTLAGLQAASALGQAELQRAWHDAFDGLRVAQVLLTGAEIADRRAYVNVRNALHELFRLDVVPIVNENDATSTDEISFGDNDVLAAQVAVLLRARRLVLLTSVDGVLDEGRVVAHGAAARDAALGPPSETGRGGMESKIAAAELAAAGGVPTAIGSPRSLEALLRGDDAGTRFPAHGTGEPAFKLWLRHGKRAVSRIEVDAGAMRAVAENGSSLLAVGVVSWSAPFAAGDGVDICLGGSAPFARGISSVDSAELAPRAAGVEVVHRDRLALL